MKFTEKIFFAKIKKESSVLAYISMETILEMRHTNKLLFSFNRKIKLIIIKSIIILSVKLIRKACTMDIFAYDN